MMRVQQGKQRREVLHGPPGPKEQGSISTYTTTGLTFKQQEVSMMWVIITYLGEGEERKGEKDQF